MNANSSAMLGVATERHVKLSNANDWPRSAHAQTVVAVGSRSLTQQAPVQQVSHPNGSTPGKAQSALPSFQSGAAAAGYGSRHGLLRAPATSTAGPWSSKRPQRGAGSARRVLGGATSAGLPQARPNPSLKLTRYGRHCKPGLRYSAHSLSPGLQYLPPRAA
jgi:hypothetical protein